VSDIHATKLVPVQPAAIAQPMDRAIHPMIAALADGRIDAATVREMVSLQREHEGNEARKAYAVAMTALKSALPARIAKDGLVNYQPQGKERVTYRHATLAGVVDAVVGHLTAHGFSHSWIPARLPSGNVQVTCRLTHCQGHSESCTLDAAVDGSGGKNSIQAVGSTVSYLERYTILSLLGLATGDMPTGEEPAAKPAEGIDTERNLRAVSAAQKAGLVLDEVAKTIGRPATEWTAADRERVRDMIQARKPRAPRENADGSVDVDPPKDA
jgi:hypothetical protein